MPLTEAMVAVWNGMDPLEGVQSLMARKPQAEHT
jgi:hypothetical protein